MWKLDTSPEAFHQTWVGQDDCIGGMDCCVQRCKLKGNEIEQQTNLLSQTCCQIQEKMRCWTERVVGEEWKEPENQTSSFPV